MAKTIFFPISNSGGSVYILKTFKDNGYRVIAGDATPYAIGRYIADAFYQLPWRREPNYFDEVIRIIKQEQVDVYVSSGEWESLQVARTRDKFLALGCTPTAANLKTLELGVDKCKLFHFFKEEVDIPLPLFHSVETLEDFEAGLVKMRGVRICMKPAVASGSRGFIEVSDEPIPPEQIFSKRLNHLVVTPDYVRDAFRKNAIPKMIMMEFLEGEDNLNASLVGKDGKLIYSCVHTREAVKDGLSTRGRIVKNDEIVEYNRRIAEALDLTGYIVAQYIGNKIIEINPRWSTSIIHGSVNEFLMGVKVWTGEQIDIDPNDVKIQQTLTYERYYETLIHDDQGNQF